MARGLRDTAFASTVRWLVAAAVIAGGAGVAVAMLSPWLALAVAVIVAVVVALAVRRPGASSHRPKAARDSWGGRAVVFYFASVVLTALLSRVVDGTTERFDAHGGRYFTSSGSLGQTIGLLVWVAAVGCAVVAAVQARRGPWMGGYAVGLGLTILCWVGFTVVRGEVSDATGLATLAGVLILLAGVVMSPPTRQTLVTLTHLLNFLSATMLAYAFLYPEEQRECRLDKCGLFDSLFTGYLSQENSAARLIVLALPVAAAVRSRSYLVLTFVLAGTFLAGTGSRTSQLTFLAVVVLVAWLRRAERAGQREVRVHWLVRAVPLGALLASLGVFLFAQGSAFTGRGVIYAAIRNALDSYTLFVGSGADTLSQVRLAGAVMGEHGQVPHLLVSAGGLGLLFFGGACLALLVTQTYTWPQAVSLSLVVAAATQFVTEPAWNLDARAMPLGLMLLTIGYFCGTAPGQPGGEPQPVAVEESAVAAIEATRHG